MVDTVNDNKDNGNGLTESHRRWDALMSSAKIRFIGSARLGEKTGQVLCVEFHSDRPLFDFSRDIDLDIGIYESKQSKGFLEEYTDTLIKVLDASDYVWGTGVAPESGTITPMHPMRISEISRVVHKNAVDHGFWEKPRSIPEMLCLIHSEVSEALEAKKKGNMDNFEEELADIAIRLFDMCEGLDIDLEAAIAKKHAFNKTRPHKHDKDF